MPFLLLPFRPTSDPSAARSFIRHFFDRSQRLYGEALAQELRLTEPMVSFNWLRGNGRLTGSRFYAVWSNGVGAGYLEEL